MKTKYLILLFIIAQNVVYNQNEGQCVNEVSTNQTAPYNNALPNDPNGMGYDAMFINHFNWIPFKI
jgi:hypothetical protein